MPAKQSITAPMSDTPPHTPPTTPPPSPVLSPIGLGLDYTTFHSEVSLRDQLQPESQPQPKALALAEVDDKLLNHLQQHQEPATASSLSGAVDSEEDSAHRSANKRTAGPANFDVLDKVLGSRTDLWTSVTMHGVRGLLNHVVHAWWNWLISL